MQNASFMELAWSTVEYDMLILFVFVDERPHPHADSQKLGHETTSIIYLFCLFGCCGRLGYIIAEFLSSLNIQYIHTRSLLFEYFDQHLSLGALATAGSADKNKSLGFLLHT